MPIYEYLCRRCHGRFSVLTLRVSERPSPRCDRCGSRSAQRIMSRVTLPRSDEARMNALSDPSALTGLDENDPRSMARWMRKMGKEMGEEGAGEDFDEMMDEMEAGEDNDEEN